MADSDGSLENLSTDRVACEGSGRNKDPARNPKEVIPIRPFHLILAKHLSIFCQCLGVMCGLIKK